MRRKAKNGHIGAADLDNGGTHNFMNLSQDRFRAQYIFENFDLAPRRKRSCY
jgi:hypothetical protein